MECHLSYSHKIQPCTLMLSYIHFKIPKHWGNPSLITLLGASVSHVFIAHYHYKLHQEGLRYSHTIPRHPVGLMQHLSPGWSVCTLLWWGRCRQCSVALHITIQKTALLKRSIQKYWCCLLESAHIYTVSWHPLSAWVLLSPLMITYYREYTHYWTHVDCLAVGLFKA